MYINAGNLNKKIEIVKFEESKDGFPVKNEVLVLKTWAQVTNISETELVKSNSDFAQTKTRFLIRTPNKAIEKDMFIKFRNNFYNIIYINNYTRIYICVKLILYIYILKIYHIHNKLNIKNIYIYKYRYF